MAESALIFDTHEDIQELVKSGMPEPQAETVVRQRVRLLERNLATKADIAATNANIETLRQETKANIAATNALQVGGAYTSRMGQQLPKRALVDCVRSPLESRLNPLESGHRSA